jgi:glucan 1,3-beta-glucosidase
MEHTDLPGGELPVGAAQPRFLGRAIQDEPGGPQGPYAHSQHAASRSIVSDNNSSVYALNPDPTRGANSGFYAGGYRDDPRDSYYAGSTQDLNMSPVGQSNRYLEEKRAAYASPKTKSKRKFIILGVLIALIVLIAAVAFPLYFFVFKPKHGASTGSKDPSKPTSSGKPADAVAITGGDGSKVTLDDGSTTTYSNTFGGYWYYDETDPFNNGAKAQSWNPALNETFNYGIDKIRGVNIGGWLTVEPFISPALFEKYLKNNPPPVDEWTLSVAMAADTAGGGLDQLEEHYKTFITEKDFAEIAAAGLNYVRIPLPYWAIETRDNEPFLAKTAWTYFLKAIKWARKYGIRINLDFHALPGSQNGWNHSGRLGTVNVLNGPMGIANAQRSLDYIRILAEFISQPQYRDVVTMFGITNEPQGPTVGQEALQSFYLQAYNIVRKASGTGKGQGPIISFHEAFLGVQKWAGFLPNADRTALDLHPYLCFGGQSNAEMSTYKNTPCQSWGGQMNDSMGAFGLTGAGEWSNAVTDCGLYVNGVNLGQRYDGTYTADGGNHPRVGSCDPWNNWPNYSDQMKNDIKNFALSSMDALGNWFFWTWKIGNSSVTNTVGSPAWSYQLGLQNGWMPKDVRDSVGACGNSHPWSPPLKAWQTGGDGAGKIDPSVTAALPWPPASINGGGAPSNLPQYTPTGPVPTLPGPSLTVTASGHSVTASAGNGWQNSGDTDGLMVNKAGCSYLDPWIGSGQPPTPLCTGPAKRSNEDEIPPPKITPPPS